MNEIEKINEKYSEKALGFYPFIGNNWVTVLKKGFYKKKEANYRGISMIYDKEQNKKKVLLIGYYYVPENYVIAPDELIMTEGREKLINRKIKEGYILTKKIRLKPYEFEEESEEYIIAKEANKKYKNEK